MPEVDGGPEARLGSYVVGELSLHVKGLSLLVGGLLLVGGFLLVLGC